MQEGSLDFVVCGMPRGGTTFFGQLFNVHPSVYCYFMETSLFRQLAQFAGNRPFPAENLPVLERWLREDMRTALVEGTQEARLLTFRRLVKYREVMQRHGLDEPSGPGIRVWDEAGFEALLRGILDLFRAGLFGPTLLGAGMRLLAHHLRGATDRPLLGEKTPDNLFFLDALHRVNPALKAFCILREPYSTIESMKRRALRNEAFGDSAFSKEVLGGIADYYRFLRAAYEYAGHAPPGAFHVHRFEDLVRDPSSVMARVYAQLGLDTPEVSCAILPQLSIPTDRRHLHDLELSATEYRLIELAVGPMLRHFGYPTHPDAGTGEPVFEEGVLPLAGLHLPHGAPLAGAWMSRRADILVLHRANRHTLVIDFGCNLPPQLGVDETMLSFEVDGRVVHSVKVPAVSPWFTVKVPLAELGGQPVGGNMVGARLVMRSSVSYAPITVAGAGHDMRDISLLVRECRLL